MKIVVLDGATLSFPREDWKAIDALGELAWYERTPPGDTALIIERLAGAGIVLSNKVPLPAEVLEASPTLKLISVLATGYNMVDLAAASARGITVCNVSGYSTDAVAQHTVAMILHATNHLGFYPGSVRSGDWIRSEDFYCLPKVPKELSELTVGIIGFGAIGRKVGSLLAPFGPRIIASQRTPRDAPDWKDFAFGRVEEILKAADIVTLHCPQTPATTRMMNAESLSTMKDGAWLINTARGGLIDETALSASLGSGKLAGAWLDVATVEPMALDNPLRTVPNCYFTPHIAWASEPSRRRLLDESVENLKAFIDGNPRNVVEA